MAKATGFRKSNFSLENWKDFEALYMKELRKCKGIKEKPSPPPKQEGKQATDKAGKSRK